MHPHSHNSSSADSTATSTVDSLLPVPVRHSGAAISRPHIRPAVTSGATGSSPLLVLDLDDQRLRVLLRDGRPWFAATDALALVGLRRDALERLAADQRDRADVPTGGTMRALALVNLSGLYALLHVAREAVANEDDANSTSVNSVNRHNTATGAATLAAKRRLRDTALARLDRMLTYRVQPVLHAAGWLAPSDADAATWCRQLLNSEEATR